MEVELVIPLIVADEKQAQLFAQWLFEYGVNHFVEYVRKDAAFVEFMKGLTK